MSESLVINALIEFGATATGVVLALLAESWYRNKQFQKRLNEIIPNVYLELAENWRLTTNNLSNFITNYWGAHRQDLSKWNENEIILKIIRVYNRMELEEAPRNCTSDKRREIGTALVDILKWFEVKAESDPDFKARLEEYDKYYSEMRNAYTTMGDPIHFKPKYYRG